MFMMIVDELKKALEAAFQAAWATQPEELNLTNPEPEFGDFALACHAYARELKISPPEIAAKLREHLKSEIVAKAEVAAGYLNLTVDNAYLARTVLGAVIKADKHYGRSQPTGEKIVVEYSSPNTNKPLHLGHVRNNALGMAIVYLLEAAGGQVKKVQIINDRGIHIIKSMLAYQKWGKGQTPEDTGEKGDHFVGRFYVKFNQAFEAEWKAWLETQPDMTNLADEELAKKKQEWFGESAIGGEAQTTLRAWEANDPAVRALWQRLNSWVYEGFAATYQALGSKFDKNYYESEIYLQGKEMVAAGLAKGVFIKEGDGSVWVDLTDAGLDKKILQRSDGTAVYITQDLALAVLRQRDFNFDRLLYVVGHEQEYHFKVLKATLKKLGYSWADKLFHLAHGLVFLPEGKLKSREGKVVDADAIIAEMRALARQEIKNREPGVVDPDLEARASMIALGALKFFVLRITAGQLINYNPAEAISLEGNTGPYIQYACARLGSILKEETLLPPDRVDFSCLSASAEKALLLKLLHYPQAVIQAAEHYNPSLLCENLFGLAHAFSTFYHKHHILRAENEATKQARLFLAKAVQIVLRNGLELLGIEAPDKM